MTQSFIQLPADSTGKQIGTDLRADSTHMQNFVLYGPTGAVISSSNPLNVLQADNSTGATNITAASGFGALSPGSLSNTAAAANSTCDAVSSGATGVASIQLTGTFVGTFVFEASMDGGNYWFPVNAAIPGSGNQVGSTTAAGIFRVNAAGCTNVRVRCTSYTSGTAVANVRISQPSGMVTPTEPLPLVIGNQSFGATGTSVGGTKNALDVNLAGSATGYTQTSQVVTTSTVPGTPNTASTTSAAVAAVADAGNATITITGGSYTGSYTFAFEASDDGGTTWFPVMATREDNALSATGDVVTGSAGAGATHMWAVSIPGFTHIRCRATAVPGTITTGVTVRISPGPFLVEPSPVVQNSPLDGSKPTYSAASTSVAMSSATAGVMAAITGSATRVVRVTRFEAYIGLSGTTAGAITAFALVKTTTANSGFPSALTPGAFDSSDAAATATVASYAAAASVGTIATNVAAARLLPPVSSVAPLQFGPYYFGNRPGKGVVLRGTTQTLSLYLPSAPSSALTFSFLIEWTEEAL